MKDIYQKSSLFGSYADSENMVDEIDGYILVQEGEGPDPFTYKVFDDLDILIGTWKSKEDCLSMQISDYKKSNAKKIFVNVVDLENQEREKALRKPAYHSTVKNSDNTKYDHEYAGYYDDDDDFPRSYYPSAYKYVEPKKSTGFLDKLNKSDTLVIHCEDKTTEMLSQIYKGKNWDVLRDGNIDKEELHKLLESHDKIICLGHGTPGGLMNRQGGGYTIGSLEAPYLKDKKLFIIWCNASTYARTYGLHGFITGNMPSDNWEARAVGFNVSEKYMNDNITFWSKCCADHVDQALNGDPKGAAANIVKDYLAVYGDKTKWNEEELGITKYNAERTTAV